jgi:hypothetical protein
LTSLWAGLKYPKFRSLPRQGGTTNFPDYDSNPVVASRDKRIEMNQCKHPRVQIVSRDEEAEFVECLECGEIFESSEFKDMAIEDSNAGSDM